MAGPSTARLARVLQLEDRRTAVESSRDDLAETVAAMRATVPVDDTPEAQATAEAAAAMLPSAWKPQRFHAEQARAFHCTARNRAIEAGRRSGKSEGRKREIVIRALDPDWPLDDRFIVVGLPTQHQTMRLYWRALLKLLPPRFIADVRKSDCEIETVTGALIRVFGMDKPERAEGDPIDDLFLDEYADMRLGRAVIEDHLGPSLDTPDRPPGTVTAYGTTDMKSGAHFIDLVDHWAERARDGDPDYATFHWSARGIMSEEAWEKAKIGRDPASFAVEYEARRVSTGNLCYHTFDRATHLRRTRFLRDKPVIVTFDWNWDPGTACIAQEQVPSIYRAGELPQNIGDTFTAVLREVFIRRSNTEQVARKVLAELNALGHTGRVLLYGDPAGGNRGSSQTEGTDLDLVRKILRPALGDRLGMRFARAHPAIRARVNAFNARLMEAVGGGTVRMIVSPTCKELVKDFEFVQWKQGADHEIEKKADDTGKLRTHLSDGLGYYLHEVFPVIGGKRFSDEPR